ncbi:MAG TPA: fumarylacetoacetate hydrolase family protein [Baekduia sp.]|nr:fumarylacetoacetate hydrolase family protein [Baekduia sp.]
MRLDYELELALVIGKKGKLFSPEEAEEYIAGYVVFNDITARDIQRDEMKSGVRWARGSSRRRGRRPG